MFRKAFWRTGIAGLEGAPKSGDTGITVLAVDSSDNVVLCVCDTFANLPITAGYALGCVLINQDTGSIFTNQGTVLIAHFIASFTLAAGGATASNIHLTDATILIGGANGTAAEKVPSGDLTMSDSATFTVANGAITPAKTAVFVPTGYQTYAATAASWAVDITRTMAGYIRLYADQTNANAFTMTLPAAATIKSAFSSTAGAWFELTVINSTVSTVTIAGGTSTTIIGNPSLPTLKSAIIRFIVTAAGIDAVVTISN